MAKFYSEVLNMKLIILLLCAYILLSNQQGIARNEEIPAIIVFGNSISDTGNNNVLKTPLKANFPPYGRDFEGGKPTGRFSNGKILPDLIAEKLGIKHAVPAYLTPNLSTSDLQTGVCFASAGSGYDHLIDEITMALPPSAQLELFKVYIEKLKTRVGEEEGNHILSNSVYTITIGHNDVANYYNVGIRKLQFDINSYAELLKNFASEFVKEIYELGARKIALFGLMPVGCLPAERTVAGGLTRMCAENINEGVKIINSKLFSLSHSLQQSLPQSRVFYIDIYNPLLDMIENPQNYGLKVVDRGCCGIGTIEFALLCHTDTPTCLNDSEYLFWDALHPTERGYEILVDLIISKFVNI